MDDTGGMYGAMCALTGLYHRNMTGQGQHIDQSQMVSSIPLNGPALLDFTVNGRGSRRPGFPPGNRAHWPGTPLVNNYRGPTVAPHNAYRTDPGGYNDWCVIVCHSDEEWQRLVQVMGAPAWARAENSPPSRAAWSTRTNWMRTSKLGATTWEIRTDGTLPGRRRACAAGAERRGPGGARPAIASPGDVSADGASRARHLQGAERAVQNVARPRR